MTAKKRTATLKKKTSSKKAPAKKTTAKSTTQEKTSKKAATANTTAQPKRTGVLDVAAQILVKSKQPMNCKDIVEKAIAQKLWTTKGKTPAATLNAALHREIANKGKDARFVKADRGKFTLRKGA